MAMAMVVVVVVADPATFNGPDQKKPAVVGLCPSLLNSIHVCLMGIENSSVTENVIDSTDS